MYYMGRRKSIQYVWILCPTSSKLLYDFPMSDIEYPTESDRQMAWYKLYITQLLPTRYSINITNVSADIKYNR